jgi:general secretion pathway protein G
MTTKQRLNEVKSGIEGYRLQVGRLPQGVDGLLQKPYDEKTARRWAGPYLDDEMKLNDAWGEEFMYQPAKDDEGNPFTLFSWGAEGEGGDETSQISAWK